MFTSLLILILVPLAGSALADETIALTLEQAESWAVAHHPSSLSALDQVDLGQSQQQIARSAFLPSLEVRSYQSRQTENLKAMGFSFPTQFGIPNVVGPFGTFDARLRLTQQVLNLEAWQNVNAAGHALEATRLQTEAVQQQVAATAALAYVECLRSEMALNAAQANLKLAESLLQLSRDQQKNGLATGVDVTRAETMKSRQVLLVTQTQGNRQDADTRLHRALGLPMNQPIHLSTTLRFMDATLPMLQTSIDLARQQRPELQALSQLVNERESEVKAADAARYPTVGLSGDYGSSAVTPFHYNYHTYSFGIQVSMPLITGGALDARRDAAKSRWHQAELQLQDTREQVELDVRLSMTALQSCRDQLQTAQSNLRLSERLMSQATDRFQAGLGDNLEVVDAMASLAQAKSIWIDALAGEKVALINQQLAVGERLAASVSERP